MTRDAAIAAGWTYEKTINQPFDEYASRVTSEGVQIMTSDKVRYTEKETEIIAKNGGFDVQAHIVKKLFQGEIIK